MIRLGVATAAILAVMTLTVSASAHVHTRPSGTTIHSHQIEDAVHDHHGRTLDHGDHHHARQLSSSFRVERTQQVTTPAESNLVMLAPSDTTVGEVARGGVEPVIHSPPLQVLSPRAPPA
jgi:hypothetical protein